MSSFLLNDGAAWAEPGDAIVAPRLTTHGVVAPDDGATLPDKFSLRRDDDL